MVDAPINPPISPWPSVPPSQAGWREVDYWCYNLGTGENPAFTVPIPNSKITIPDVIVVLSCLILALYLIVTLPKSIRRFRSSNSPSIKIFLAYYVILWLTLLMRVGRSIFWWFSFRRDVDADQQSAANIPWIILRGTIWMAEVSVIVFLMHRNVKKYVIARVVTFTIVLGVLYMGAIGVGLMAFNLPLIGYTKGSGFFWAIHEFVLAGIYGMLLILRCVPSCAKRLPTKVSFWIYDGLLFLFHNAAAAGYLVRAIENGATSYCVVSIANVLYLGSFSWLLYFAFLYRFFHSTEEQRMRLKVYYDDQDYDSSMTTNSEYSSVGSEYQLMDDDLMDSASTTYTPAYARAWSVRKNSNPDGTPNLARDASM